MIIWLFMVNVLYNCKMWQGILLVWWVWVRVTNCKNCRFSSDCACTFVTVCIRMCMSNPQIFISFYWFTKYIVRQFCARQFYCYTVCRYVLRNSLTPSCIYSLIIEVCTYTMCTIFKSFWPELRCLVVMSSTLCLHLYVDKSSHCKIQYAQCHYKVACWYLFKVTSLQ